MPALPRRRRRQRSADSLEELGLLQHELEYGRPMLDGFESLEQMEDAWDEFGEEIIAKWIRVFAGTRPWGWWFFDHKAERPVINPRATTEFIERHRRHGFLHTHHWPRLQQDETEYLEDRGLLTPDELARIPFEEVDAEPWQVAMRGPRRRRIDAK